MGIQNAHEALSQIDVYLDTYPSCSGISAFEAMAHGVPVVTLDHPSVHSWNQFKPCVTTSESEYVEKAVSALSDLHIAAAGREMVEARITNIPRAVAGLYEALGRQGWS